MLARAEDKRDRQLGASLVQRFLAAGPCHYPKPLGRGIGLSGGECISISIFLQAAASKVSQFYVTDKESVDRARESVVSRKPVTMSGTIQDKVGFFTGPVQSVEEVSPGKWRITILDGKWRGRQLRRPFYRFCSGWNFTFCSSISFIRSAIPSSVSRSVTPQTSFR
jgi:hypothetical protein